MEPENITVPNIMPCVADNDSEPVTSANNSRFHNFKKTQFNIPIIGYEVMEERAKFTVFKLKVESADTGECWFVFRRYTDFVRFHSKLKSEYPHINLPLPKKKWFGNNYNATFLTERLEGLQELVNHIINHEILLSDTNVRDFFCLNEPPSVDENVEESKAVLETLEERVYQLQRKLKEKEVAYERLKAAHSVEISAKLRLASFVQDCTKQCSACATRLAEFSPIAS